MQTARPTGLTDEWQEGRVVRIDAKGDVTVEGDGFELSFEDLGEHVHVSQVLSVRWSPEAGEVELWEGVLHGKA